MSNNESHASQIVRRPNKSLEPTPQASSGSVASCPKNQASLPQVDGAAQLYVRAIFRGVLRHVVLVGR